MVGSALFLFGYYLGLPKSSIYNIEIATEELTPKPSEELQSKNNKPSTKSSDRDRDVQVKEEDMEEEVKKLAFPKSIEQMLLAAQSETERDWHILFLFLLFQSRFSLRRQQGSCGEAGERA